MNLWFIWLLYRLTPVALGIFAAYQLGTGGTSLCHSGQIVAGIAAVVVAASAWWLGTDAGIGWAASLRGTEREWLSRRPVMRIEVGARLRIHDRATETTTELAAVQGVVATEWDV